MSALHDERAPWVSHDVCSKLQGRQCLVSAGIDARTMPCSQHSKKSASSVSYTICTWRAWSTSRILLFEH